MFRTPCIAVLSLATLLLCCLVCEAASPGIVETVLPNGMKVIVREGHSINLAAVEVCVRAGSVRETETDNGISHFVEHMVFKATKRYGPGQIDREIESLGAELNGGTSRDYIRFYTTVESRYLEPAVNIIAEAVMNALFRTEDVEKERGVILDEIAGAESDFPRRTSDQLGRVAFTSHPYSLPPMGTRESITRLARDQLFAYYVRNYVPGNMYVVIAGDVRAEDAVAVVTRAFDGFDSARPSSGVTAARPTEEPPVSSPRLQQSVLPSGQAQVGIGYIGPKASDLRDCCAIDVILALLGDANRGRIASALNARGLKFTKVVASFSAQRDPSLFSIVVSTPPDRTDRVSPILLAEVRRLATLPVSSSELAGAKRIVEGADLFDQETFSGQARALALYESAASGDLALRYGTAVRELTAADIQSVAERYFLPESYCQITAQPRS